MRIEDRLYYLKRAEQEIESAENAAHDAARRAHYEIAGHYLDRAYRAAGGTGEVTGNPPHRGADRPAAESVPA